MRLPDGSPIHRQPTPKTDVKSDTGRPRNPGGHPAAHTPRGSADGLARQRTPLGQLAEDSSSFDRLARGNTQTEQLRDQSARVPRVAGVPVQHGVNPGVHDVGATPGTLPNVTLVEVMAHRSDEEGDESNTFIDDILSPLNRSEEEIDQILADVDTLENGTEEEQVQAVFSLAGKLQTDEIKALTRDLQTGNVAIGKLLTDTGALDAVATLVSSEASGLDKLAATITLFESTGQLASGSLAKALKGPLQFVSSGQELINAIQTFRDPAASNLQKVEALLAFAAVAPTSLAALLPTRLSNAPGLLGTLTSSLSAALTIADPNAPWEDRAKAAGELFANVPEIAGDIAELRGRLIDEVIGRHIDVAFEVPDELADALSPRMRAALTPEQLGRLNALTSELAVEGADNADNVVLKLLGNASDPNSIDTVIDLLDAQASTADRKAIASTLQALRPGTLDDLLADGANGRGVRALAELLTTLDDDAQKALGKLISEFDDDAIGVLVRLADKVDKDALGVLLKLADDIPGKQLGQALTLIDKALFKAGVDVTSEIAGQILRGAGKFIPIAGAAPAAYDLARLGLIAADTDLPPDISYLALTAAKLNGADVVLSIASAFGLPIAGDIPVGIGALITDLIVTDQKNKFEAARAAGRDYEAPPWLTTSNFAIAAAQGPQGWVEYWATYGAEGGIEAAGVAIEEGGTAAIHATEALLVLETEKIGESLEMTAEGLHLLADVIRNPEVYGARAEELGRRAVERLAEIGESVSDLAEAAQDELIGLAGELKDLGADGLDALSWIASHPGEAAEIAIDAIGDVASEALELGTAAGRRIATTALDTLDTLAALNEQLVDAVERATEAVVDRIVDLGEEGLETLAWITRNPGEAADIAKRALFDIVTDGGELAKAAYEEILDLGEAGKELALDVAKGRIDLGEDGIELLAFVATHPGEAADAAIDGLQDLASEIGDAAERAGERLTELADAGIDTAKQALSSLLLEGGEAITNVVTALGDNIGPGVAAVIDGLADLGSAGRDALINRADAGLNFAQDGLEAAGDAIKGAGEWAWNKSGGRLWNWAFGN